MSRVTILLALILALGTAAVQAQTRADVKATLEAKGFKLAAALLDIANVTNALNQPSAVYTLLVPNDLAIQNFLTKMGLTLDDLKKRPLLAKQIVAGHLILKHNVRAKELFANGNARIVLTLAGKPNELLFRRLKDGDIKVTDVQGYVANVKKHFVVDDNKTAHPIDKVLLNDEVFYNFADLCKFRALTLSSFCRAVVYADLAGTINGNKVDATVFVPNNKAFAKQLELSGGVVPSVEEAQETLKYHVVPGMKTLGGGFASSFKNGQDVATLYDGRTLKVEYEAVKPAADSKRKAPYANAFVITEIGQRVPVVKPNVHVGTAIVHGVEFVLLPSSDTSAPAAAPAAAAKPAGRRLLSFVTPLTSYGPFSGRSLLDFGWGMEAGSTAEEDAADSAIEAAADGQESTGAAAEQSLFGAEALSVPGAYERVEDGINPW